MAELANCLSCDAVFVKNMRLVCEKCFKEEEQAYEMVYRYLTKRKNRQATIMEIVAATEVKEMLIVKFIKEKRLRTSQFPNLAYPCEKCHADIVTGRLCDKCSHEIVTELDLQETLEAQKNERERKEKDQENVYYSLNKKINKKL